MVDSMIMLFKSTDTVFTTNGLGNLPDAISCVVTEERNGEYELEMLYPITGKRYEELSLRRIITAKPNPYSDYQPFRIYAISKPINGIVTINAEHISYDLSGIPVAPFVADTVQNAFINMKSSAAVPCPFSFTTDKGTTANMTVLKPSSMRALLGGTRGSILDVYGGEYEFDKFTVKLHNNRGENRGVSIRYGKNLTDLKQEENCSAVYTGVYPFWYSEQDGLMQLSEKVVKASGTYDFTRIYPLDLSQEWQDKPTETQLRERAKTYMSANNIGIPKVSLDVSFVQLAQSEEYQEIALLETVYLCDTVNVEFPELGVSSKAKCIKTKFDVLTNKYIGIELGDAKSNLASTICEQSQAIHETPSKTFMEQAIENATQLISGGLGGYVVLHSSTDSKHPDEILIMDTDNIKTATKVWRWNKGGLGYSSKGYNGPYTTAMTQDGAIVADFITTGTMSANRINGGTLIVGGNNNTNGTILVKKSDGTVLVKLDKDGITLNSEVKISYSNLSNTPSIPSKTSQLKNDSDFKTGSQVTQITKDTVTTKYVNALDVTAKQVNCVSGNNECNINGARNRYIRDGIEVGNIGTNSWSGHPEMRGLDFDLDEDGSYMFWGAQNPGGGNYMAVMVYDRNGTIYDRNSMNICRDLDLHWWKLKNVNWPEGGIDGTLHFVQILSMNSDGTVGRWVNDCSLRFVNGILVDATFNG